MHVWNVVSLLRPLWGLRPTPYEHHGGCAVLAGRQYSRGLSGWTPAIIRLWLPSRHPCGVASAACGLEGAPATQATLVGCCTEVWRLRHRLLFGPVCTGLVLDVRQPTRVACVAGARGFTPRCTTALLGEGCHSAWHLPAPAGRLCRAHGSFAAPPGPPSTRRGGCDSGGSALDAPAPSACGRLPSGQPFGWPPRLRLGHGRCRCAMTPLLWANWPRRLWPESMAVRCRRPYTGQGMGPQVIIRSG